MQAPGFFIFNFIMNNWIEILKIREFRLQNVNKLPDFQLLLCIYWDENGHKNSLKNRIFIKKISKFIKILKYWDYKGYKIDIFQLISLSDSKKTSYLKFLEHHRVAFGAGHGKNFAISHTFIFMNEKLCLIYVSNCKIIERKVFFIEINHYIEC